MKSKRLFYLRLRIGRLERCFKCNKLIINKKESLYDSLYWESQDAYIKDENHKKKVYCNKCSKKD